MEDDITITANSPLVYDTMNTITLGPTGSADTLWPAGIDLGSLTGKRKSHLDETSISYKVSPLAIILQLLENGTETYNIMDSMQAQLGESVSSLNITEDNIQLADEIKEYYRAKIITETLSATRKRSEYRSDLMMALALLDVCQTKRGFMPMLIKLRDFYNEDIKMERITSEYKTASVTEASIGSVSDFKVVTLNFVDQVTVNRRNQKMHQFYFTDSKGHVYLLTTELKNPLIPFLTMLTSKVITLRCRVKPMKHSFYDFNFYSILDKFEVLEIQ